MTTLDDLVRKKCVPCAGGTQPFDQEKISCYTMVVPDWQVVDGKTLRRTWKAADFAAALAFLDAVGKLAEEEGHHPDLHLTGYRSVTIELSTHAIGGLSENDFILAAKIDALPGPTSA